MAKQGSPTFNDLRLAGQVRTKCLKLIDAILDDESESNREYRKQMILRMAPNMLPRLNEHTGQDGEPLPILGGLATK